jgi:hypothetical protein
MYAKLLLLFSQVLFYELDYGVDIRISNQQRNLIFSSHNIKALDIADQARRFFNKTLYIKQSKINKFETLVSFNYEPIHFILTTAWLVMGGLFQSFVVLKSIQDQPYIPIIWKVAIVISTFFLIGPLFIFYFSIFILLNSNTSIPEKKRIILLVDSRNKQINL